MDGPLLSHCMVDAKSACRCPSRFFDNPISTVFAAAATAASGDAVGVVYVKDMRVMTAVLRPLDETRWEVVCRVNGELYKAEVVSNRWWYRSSHALSSSFVPRFSELRSSANGHNIAVGEPDLPRSHDARGFSGVVGSR